ncbi:MAG: hypothetical protein WD623_11110 [Marinobacter sp.]|uniref:hypothetical protein n=1 Tax=Marinobacter sp. TaxID=50741 RepID=UPI0034A00363
MVARLIIFYLAVCPPLVAAVTIAEYDRPAFNPSNGEHFEIPIIPNEAGTLAVIIKTPDGDKVRRLETTVPDNAVGERVVLKWNGRDTGNAIVPDEAYIPILIMGETVHNPADYSGGEVIEGMKPDFASKGVGPYRFDIIGKPLSSPGISNAPGKTVGSVIEGASVGAGELAGQQF